MDPDAPVPYKPSPSSLTKYDSSVDLSYLVREDPLTLEPFADEGTLIVYTDGACSSNGQADAQAGIAGYFGPNSRYNLDEALCPHCKPQTSQFAELFAIGETLHQVHNTVLNDLEDDASERREVEDVVVVTDSAYAVGCLSEWITKWRTNGFKNCKGNPVEHGDLIQDLDDLLNHLSENHGVSVRFWQVPREWNRVADRMAKRAVKRGFEPV